MVSRVPPRRCSEHDLSVGPDGRCALCRRAAPPEVALAQPASQADERPNLLQWFFGTGLCASLATVVWMSAQQAGPPGLTSVPGRRAPSPQLAAAAAKSATPPRPEPATDPTLEPNAPIAAQTNQATPETPAPEPISPTQPATETSNTLTPAQAAAEARKLADAERDRQRHEAVTRDLQNMGLAAARRNVVINMYSTSWCGACARARAYMTQQNIAFTDFDVERDASANARAAQLNPRGSVPTIVVDDEVIIGFSANSLETRIERAARRRVSP